MIRRFAFASDMPSQLPAHSRIAFFRGGEEFAARGATGQWLATADSWILEDLGKVKSLHIPVGGNALALGFESQATIGLFFT
jgi:hypothetical protein